MIDCLLSTRLCKCEVPPSDSKTHTTKTDLWYGIHLTTCTGLRVVPIASVVIAACVFTPRQGIHECLPSVRIQILLQHVFQVVTGNRFRFIRAEQVLSSMFSPRDLLRMSSRVV